MIFKFRSWDHRNKVMDFPDHIANDIDGDKYQIQMFTGLKDKNGKEIYEGDIVKSEAKHESQLFRPHNYTHGVIEYYDGAFHVCQKGVGAIFIGDTTCCDCHPCGLEVIGNIYENPGLLK